MSKDRAMMCNRLRGASLAGGMSGKGICWQVLRARPAIPALRRGLRCYRVAAVWAGSRTARVGQTLDGDEATRRLKANAVLHAIPVIAVTSYASSSDVDKARAAGGDALCAFTDGF